MKCAGGGNHRWKVVLNGWWVFKDLRGEQKLKSLVPSPSKKSIVKAKQFFMDFQGSEKSLGLTPPPPSLNGNGKMKVVKRLTSEVKCDILDWLITVILEMWKET